MSAPNLSFPLERRSWRAGGPAATAARPRLARRGVSPYRLALIVWAVQLCLYGLGHMVPVGIFQYHPEILRVGAFLMCLWVTRPMNANAGALAGRSLSAGCEEQKADARTSLANNRR